MGTLVVLNHLVTELGNAGQVAEARDLVVGGAAAAVRVVGARDELTLRLRAHEARLAHALAAQGEVT